MLIIASIGISRAYSIRSILSPLVLHGNTMIISTVFRYVYPHIVIFFSSGISSAQAM